MKVGKGKGRQPKNDFSISLKTCAWLTITSADILHSEVAGNFLF